MIWFFYCLTHLAIYVFYFGFILHLIRMPPDSSCICMINLASDSFNVWFIQHLMYFIMIQFFLSNSFSTWFILCMISFTWQSLINLVSSSSENMILVILLNRCAIIALDMWNKLTTLLKEALQNYRSRTLPCLRHCINNTWRIQLNTVTFGPNTCIILFVYTCTCIYDSVYLYNAVLPHIKIMLWTWLYYVYFMYVFLLTAAVSLASC